MSKFKLKGCILVVVLSYSANLHHTLVLDLANMLFSKISINGFSIFLFLNFFMLTFIVAATSYLLVEKPFNGLR